MFCPTCGVRQPDEHRFCFSCGALMPRQLIERRGPKESRWFLSVPVLPDDPPRGALRVSRYLEQFEATTAEGSVLVPSHHVRFSIWVDDAVVSAISLPDDEATSLGEFLLAQVRGGDAEPSVQTPSPR
ncbi:MAG: zinc ribbon domain-containing protein [Actinomycetota bacterium]